MVKHASVAVFVVFALFSTDHAQAATRAFDPVKDCAVQPWGLDPDTQPGDDSNEMLPELPATDQPDFIPEWQIKDLVLRLAQPILKEKAQQLVDALKGVCLSKKNHDLHVTIYFKDYFSIELKNYGLAKKMEPYRVDSPPALRLRIRKAKSLITADFLGRRGGTLQVFAKIPVIADRIYFHRVMIDLNTQWAKVYLAKMRDRIGFVLWTQFDPDAPFKIHLSFWETLRHFLKPVPRRLLAVTPTN